MNRFSEKTQKLAPSGFIVAIDYYLSKWLAQGKQRVCFPETLNIEKLTVARGTSHLSVLLYLLTQK